MVKHIYSKDKDQQGKVANPARGQLNREDEYFPDPVLVPENLASRHGYGNPIPRQPAHLHTQAESGAYLRHSPPVTRRCLFIYRNCMYVWSHIQQEYVCMYVCMYDGHHI